MGSVARTAISNGGWQDSAMDLDDEQLIEREKEQKQDAFLKFIDYARSVLSVADEEDGETSDSEDTERDGPGWSWIASRVLKTCISYSSGLTAAILRSELSQNGYRFNISKQWDTMDPEADRFRERLVDAMASDVWIADMWILKDSIRQMIKVSTHQAKAGARTMSRADARPPGHTVVITGYGLLAEQWFWEFLNSHGQDYADQGFGKASDEDTLNWLYKPKVVRWW